MIFDRTTEIVIGLTAIGAFISGTWGIIALIRRKAKKILDKLDLVYTNLGTNGSKNVFQTLHALGDAIAMHGSVADLSPQPLMVFDPAGNCTSLNPACARLIGWTLDELRDGGWIHKLSEDGAKAWRDALTAHAVFDERLLFTPRIGEVLLANVYAKPVHNGEKFLGWRCAISALPKPAHARSLGMR